MAALGTLAAVGGIVIGYFLWFADKETQQERDKFRIPVLYPLLEHKYYIDDFYMDGIIRPLRGPVARGVDWFNGHVIDLVINGVGVLATKVAKAVYWFDQKGVDGAINASAAAAGGAGGMLRLLQTGRIQQYAFLVVAGTVVLVAGFIIF
jgi:NADH-quinone oxidoreductase subunit L